MLLGLHLTLGLVTIKIGIQSSDHYGLRLCSGDYSKINSQKANCKALKAMRKGNSRPMIVNSYKVGNSQVHSNYMSLSAMQQAQTITMMLIKTRKLFY